MTSRTRVPRAVAAAAATALLVAARSSTAGEADPSAAPAGGGEPIELSYLHRLPDGEGMTPVAEIVDRWNAEHPNIQVTATKFDGAAPDMILKLETDVGAGNAPCLAQLGYAEIPQLFVKGLLEDVAEEAAAYESEFSAGAYSLVTVGDATVGLPQDTGPLVYFYNEAEFERLGIAVPETLEDLAAASETAAADGAFVTSFTPDEALNWLSAQSAAAGDEWFGAGEGGWSVDIEGEGSERVAAFWQDRIDNDETLVTERWGEGFTQALNDGSLIGHVGAAWEAGFMLDSLDGTDAEGQWRVAQLPDFGAGATTGADGGSGVAVMAGCEHPVEAMEFNAWFNTQIDDLASQGLVVAANGTPATSDKMLRQFGGQDVLEELATASGNMNPDFVYAPGFASLTVMSETAAGVADGSATVADVFGNAQTSAVSTLQDLGLPVAE
ncbi:ABC transporter substrate-binding protein [Agrococcus sp. Ld7]|uniref:ABC transporter substrate-binding protein n=1 Tax=Agrococcus sp. Ld7 TaxID=649148 RepID=UPI00386EC4AA